MNSFPVAILVIEDNEGDWFLIKEYLTELYKENYILQSSKLSDAIVQLGQRKFDAILLDLNLPDSVGTRSIEKIIAVSQDAPVIILTGYTDIKLAVESLKLGVQDYLLKDEITAALLLKSIAYSIERNKVRLQLINEQKQRETAISDAVITALEKERAALSAELHDNISQLMTSSMMFVKLAKKNKEKAETLLDESISIITAATAEIRILSHELAPPKLNHDTLEEALMHLIKKIKNSSDLQVTEEWNTADINTLPEKLALNIFRIVQEQLNNIVKYAQAKTISIKLAKVDYLVFLNVKDDGIGFDTSIKTNGVGLANMQTRTQLFNGKLVLNASPLMGCELEAVFNLNSLI
jgi:signal transduction histidine kinase